MAKINFTSDNLKFRPATPEDAAIAGPLILRPFQSGDIFGWAWQRRAGESHHHSLVALPGHRFSYEVTQLAIYDGRIIGLMVIYPGRNMEAGQKARYAGPQPVSLTR